MSEVKKDPQVDYVVTEFQRYENFHKERYEKAKTIIDYWHNKIPKKGYSWQNNVNVPLMVEGEQTITPRLYTALFPNDAPVDVHVEGDAPPEQGIRIKSIIKHHFRVSNVQGETYPALTQCSLIGTGYVEGGSWYVRKAWQQTKEGVRYYAPIENRPDCTFVDFFEMFPHPAKRQMKDALPLIRRRYIDEETLKGIAKESRFDSTNLEEALKSETPNPTAAYSQTKAKEYEVLDYWGGWDEQYAEGDQQMVRKAVPYWIIIINRSVKLRAIPNPYNHQIPPFCKFKLFEDPEPSWFGVGIGQCGFPTQERINKIVNQRLDNVDLVLNKQGCYNGNDPLINIKKLLVSEPGKWHKVSDTITSLRWQDTPDVTQSSYEEEKIAKNDFREATGAIANLMPEIGSEHRTAAGIEMLQGAAGMRFRPVLRKLETDLIAQLAMFFFSNLKQFMTEAEWVQITGKNGKVEPIQIRPEEIQAKVYFIPTGISETLNKEVMVGQLLRFKEISVQDPTINRQEINRRIAELMGFKDIEKLMTPMKQTRGTDQLSTNDMMSIQQRIAEGADPEQIKAEMLGPRQGANQPPQPQQ